MLYRRTERLSFGVPFVASATGVIGRAIGVRCRIRDVDLCIRGRYASAQATCPCSIWDISAVPTVESENDAQAVEVGVKFRSDVDGTITGIRFYKGALNVGPHTGNLWDANGQLLATVNFTNETASGWQQADFGTPVEISANTTYVASYHTQSGRLLGRRELFRGQWRGQSAAACAGRRHRRWQRCLRLWSECVPDPVLQYDQLLGRCGL